MHPVVNPRCLKLFQHVRLQKLFVKQKLKESRIHKVDAPEILRFALNDISRNVKL